MVMREPTNEDIVEEKIRVWCCRDKEVSILYSAYVTELLGEFCDCNNVGIYGIEDDLGVDLFKVAECC